MAVATISLKRLPDSPARRGRFYRPDLDGLRALAIIAVVAFHARLAFFSGGFVGVMSS